jgi:hypothetical protein
MLTNHRSPDILKVWAVENIIRNPFRQTLTSTEERTASRRVKLTVDAKIRARGVVRSPLQKAAVPLPIFVSLRNTTRNLLF